MSHVSRSYQLAEEKTDVIESIGLPSATETEIISR
jgi:hypothetical protein